MHTVGKKQAHQKGTVGLQQLPKESLPPSLFDEDKYWAITHSDKYGHEIVPGPGITVTGQHSFQPGTIKITGLADDAAAKIEHAYKVASAQLIALQKTVNMQKEFLKATPLPAKLSTTHLVKIWNQENKESWGLKATAAHAQFTMLLQMGTSVNPVTDRVLLCLPGGHVYIKNGFKWFETTCVEAVTVGYVVYSPWVSAVKKQGCLGWEMSDHEMAQWRLVTSLLAIL